MAVPPFKCLSMLCCEKVYHLQETGNLIIINAFHNLGLEKFPANFGPITVMYSATEGHGVYETELSLISLASVDVVKTWKDTYRVVDPLSIGDVFNILRNVRFEQPGKYVWELKCNGEVIGSLPFYVFQGKRNPNIRKGKE